MDEVQTSLEVCRERHWRCEALSLSGSRCCNHWDGHEKGHQFSDSLRLGPTDIASRGVQSLKTLANTATPTLTVGNFESSVSSDKILSSLYEEISRVLQVETSDRKLAFNQTARGSGVADVISNRTCFACLSNCPVYILPCNKIQHTICEACVERFSTIDPNSTAVLALDQCPLGCPLTTSPWMIRRKPLQAGVRILTLDG